MNERRGLLKMLALAFMFVVGMSACSDDDPKPLAAPTLNNATEIATTSFKASWTAVNNAEKYLLDVSTDANFANTVTGYNKKEIVGATNTVVNGLTGATKYYFRVYAKKGSKTSAASAVKDATTTAP